MNKIFSLKLTRENLAATLMIAMFAVFLLVNFIVGFNVFLYIIVAVCGLVLSIIYPRSGLYAVLVLTLIFAKFFTLQSIFLNEVEYKFYLVDVIMVGMFFGLLLRLLRQQIKLNLKLADSLLLIFMVLTAIYFVASIFYLDGEFATAFSSLKNYIFYPLLYFATLVLINSQERLAQFFKFLMFGGLVIIGFIVFGLITGQGLWTEITPLSTEGSRILDFDHAFYLSLVSLTGLSYLLVRNNQKNKANSLIKLWYILLPIFAIGVVGSLMRHLWIAMFIALAFLYLIIHKQHRELLRKLATKYLVVLIMVLSVIVLFINLLPTISISQELVSVQSRLINRAISVANASDTSIAWRSVVWQGVWKEYQNNIVLGLGFGQKIFIDMGSYRDYVEVRNIHNSWLAIFVQMGLISFAVFLWFYFNVLYNTLIKKVKNSNFTILQLASLSIGIFCLVAFAFQPYLEANFFNIIFWLNLGLARRYYEGFTS